MFEGFPDGPWLNENDEDYLPPEPPKWWENLIVGLGFVAIIGVAFKVFFHGI